MRVTEIMKRFSSWLLVGCFLVTTPCAMGQEKKDALPEAVAVEIPSAVPSSTKTNDAKLRPLTVSVELLSQAVIAGTMAEVSQIHIKTAFGEATIPMSEIAGIRLATTQDSTTTVVMLNGDSITGATDIKQLTIDTEWGSAKINGTAIQSILFVPDLKWVNSNSLNGRRWFLVDAKQAPNATANPNNPGGIGVPANPSVGNPNVANPNPTVRPNANPNFVPR